MIEQVVEQRLVGWEGGQEVVCKRWGWIHDLKRDQKERRAECKESPYFARHILELNYTFPEEMENLDRAEEHPGWNS
jgi:hypothetical protein